jgi:hypothetical protein
MIQSLHYLAPVQIGGTGLGGITAADNGLENEIRAEPASGELTARIQALVKQGFQPTFTTHEIADSLSICGVLGCLLSTKNLVMYAQQGSDDGRRAASGHLSFTYARGLLYPQSLECNHQGDATINYGAAITWDGSHTPVVIGAGALPSITAASLWTLKSATLGGMSIPQLQSVRINFGLSVQVEGGDSDIWGSKVSITAVNPVISVTSNRIAEFFGVLGASGTASITLRERAEGGTFTDHELTLSGSGLATFSKPFGASGGKPGENAIEARPKYDGTHDPIVMTTNW